MWLISSVVCPILLVILVLGLTIHLMAKER